MIATPRFFRTSETGPSRHLLRYRDSELWALPSRHWSIEFAALALRAGLRNFDRILLELPASLPVTLVQETLLTLGGAPGAILLPHLGPFPARIREAEEDECPDERPLYFSSMVPLVHDSMLTTLRALARLGVDAPPVTFVDADPEWGGEGRRRSRPAFPAIDPQEVASRGLAGWYARWEPALRAAPPIPEDERRERVMAERLRAGALNVGGRTLFICGAAHWPRICDLLDGPAAEPGPARTTAAVAGPPRTAAIGPAAMYSWGLIDIPYLDGRFERAFVGGTSTFDRAREIRRLVAATVGATHRAAGIRPLLLMQDYVGRLLGSAGRWSADLDRHLLPAARAAVGGPFAGLLERQAMTHPSALPASLPEARVTPLGRIGWALVLPDETHVVKFDDGEDPPPPDAAPRPFRRPVPQRMSEKERRRAEQPYRLRMKVGNEERLHLHMCNAARRAAHETHAVERLEIPVRFRGRMERGIETKRTLRARARGMSDIYVRRRIRRRDAQPECDGCPIVWVFDARAPIVHQTGDFYPGERNERIMYSSFFWFSVREPIGDVRRNRIAYFVRVCRNVTPSWDRALVQRELFDRVPPAFRCQTNPENDSDLTPAFEGPDLAVACAVRWTMTDHVVLVRADPSYTPGEEVRDYAAGRGVRILETDASGCDGALLARYQRDFEVPTQDPWKPPDPVFLRVVEPVPGFEDEPGAIARPEGGPA